MTPAADSPLAIAISMAVPLWIAEYRARGGPTGADLERARGFSRLIGEKGDRLLHRSKVAGEVAQVFNALAEGIAVLAFCPGGVRFCGQRYQADGEP